jgi:SAM-dependent methyltransferase
MLTRQQDAFGQLVFDYYHGIPAVELVERGDGWIAPSGGPAKYFEPYSRWPVHQRRAMGFVRGRALDIGCGPGRVALHLQARKHSVLGIDNSPLAIRTARLRGVRHARVLSATQLSARLGVFDTLLMLGNNFGLLANPTRARWLLQRFCSLTAADGRIVAEILNPYETSAPEHLRYHNWNRRRGRMAGQTRLRVRYKDVATPWFDYLFVSPRELRALLSGTSWRVERLVQSAGPTYIAVLGKGAV